MQCSPSTQTAHRRAEKEEREAKADEAGDAEGTSVDGGRLGVVPPAAVADQLLPACMHLACMNHDSIPAWMSGMVF